MPHPSSTMWKVLVNPFRSRWKGRKGARHTEERLEPIAPRIVPPQPSSENAPHTAPTHPHLEPTPQSTPTQPFPEDASSSALAQPLQEHDPVFVPTQPPQEPTRNLAATGTPPEATPNFALTQPSPEPPRIDAQQAPQFFCGSSNNSFGSLAITTVQGTPDKTSYRRRNAKKHSSDSKLGEKRVAEGRYCIGRAEGSDDGLVVSSEDWVKIRDEQNPKARRRGTVRAEEPEEVLQFRHMRKQPIRSHFALNASGMGRGPSENKVFAHESGLSNYSVGA
ncbi:hypothetical protein D9611_012609 [Ephemerocybe angulata]|uniref:Uncharacterized protein n=1 Tax=Ephemerocybe angulata TaxID=980116 RepID=A0A8H5AVI7_9AGAR|nr:hypothetical protein D9611_012609 [Tulosesus angulatus]